ncbi:hypothetical protein CO251_12195 [Sulfobacillus sp. hq2]|nr:hypothetical protein CO251_12195 [Sulfobacillus sp. hq2]
MNGRNHNFQSDEAHCFFWSRILLFEILQALPSITWGLAFHFRKPIPYVWFHRLSVIRGTLAIQGLAGNSPFTDHLSPTFFARSTPVFNARSSGSTHGDLNRE